MTDQSPDPPYPPVVDRGNPGSGHGPRCSHGRRRTHARRRCDRRVTPAAPDGGSRRHHRGRRSRRTGEDHRRLRRSPTAHRLLPRVVAGSAGRRAVRGLHLLRRPGPRADVPPLHRDATYATLCKGPYEESVRYRDFLGLDMPWYSVHKTAAASCWKVVTGSAITWSSTYTTASRCPRRTTPVVAASRSWRPRTGCWDMTVYGRQEAWEDSPDGWPRPWGDSRDDPQVWRTNGRPMALWCASHRSRPLRRPDLRVRPVPHTYGRAGP